MMRWVRNLIFVPLQIAGRITLGVTGFTLLGSGLFLTDILALGWVGIPMIVAGFLCVVRAVF